MEKFKILHDEMERAIVDANKLFVDDNLQAGKRYYARLANIKRMWKAARVELKIHRKMIRERRAISNAK